MGAIELLLHLASGQDCFFNIDDDHIIAAVLVRSVFGFALATQDMRGGGDGRRLICRV